MLNVLQHLLTAVFETSLHAPHFLRYNLWWISKGQNQISSRNFHYHLLHYCCQHLVQNIPICFDMYHITLTLVFFISLIIFITFAYIFAITDSSSPHPEHPSLLMFLPHVPHRPHWIRLELFDCQKLEEVAKLGWEHSFLFLVFAFLKHNQTKFPNWKWNSLLMPSSKMFTVAILLAC